MISGKLGGKSNPKLPEVVISPRENESGRRCWRRAGKSSPPSATIVIPEAPVKAVKRAQTIMAIMASPPGSQPSKAWEKRTSRDGAPLSARRKPVRAKSGMAVKVGVSASRYISMKTTVKSISAREKCKRAIALMTTKSGTPARAARVARRLLTGDLPECEGGARPARGNAAPSAQRRGESTVGRSKRGRQRMPSCRMRARRARSG